MVNLKLHFGKLLKKHIKEAGLRQFDIAETLKLSPSAVSQMISGRMSPNLKQLDAILERLSLDRASSAELRDCLSRIRSGDENLRSPLNEFIKSNRVAKGLSLEQLSNITGIPVADLDMFENRLNVQPSPYEAVRLAAVFNCNISEFWQSDVQTAPQEKPQRQIYVMREGKNVYHPGGNSVLKAPVVSWDDFKNFNPDSDHLVDFAWRHTRSVESDFPAGAVIVTASGAEFGWSEFYKVRLLISDTPQWLPGMTVLCNCNNKLILGKATEEKSSVIAIGSKKIQQCKFYWLVNSFNIESEFFEKSDGDKKNQHKTVLDHAVVNDNAGNGADDE